MHSASVRCLHRALQPWLSPGVGSPCGSYGWLSASGFGEAFVQGYLPFLFPPQTGDGTADENADKGGSTSAPSGQVPKTGTCIPNWKLRCQAKCPRQAPAFQIGSCVARPSAQSYTADKGGSTSAPSGQV